MTQLSDGTRLRLAELVAALSLGVDLGFGQPMEHVLRQCLIALRLAERMGLDEDERATVYYTALLINVGCHTDAHEQAKWFGDDLDLKSTKYDYGLRSVRGAVASFAKLGAGHPFIQRMRIGVEFVVSGHRDLSRMVEHHAEMARTLAEQLGLADAILEAVGAAYEQWDGKGWPGALAGEGVPLATRIASLAEFVEVAHRVGGVEEAKTLARKHRGGQFDPRVADIVIAEGDVLLADLDQARAWDTVIEVEPSLAVILAEQRFDTALDAVANFIDLKSPYLLGHARGVADLAAAAAAELSMQAEEIRTLSRAGLIHGLGRLGVSNAIWDKPGPLGAGEWERVRLHPYLTERMLQQSPALAPLGAIAVQLRERGDGSGYPRGLTAAAISRPARILAAADAYQAMREPRPYREARSPAEAAAELRAEVKAGRLDDEAVRGVLAAAGHRVPRRREGPAGLTAREVEVLRLAARGLTNKDISALLVISPKTVANHIEHIYTKIGATSRPMASLFAMKHGLLPEEESIEPDPAGRSAAVHLLRPPHHVRFDLAHDLGRAEGHELTSAIGACGVAGGDVERIARPELLLRVAVAEPDAALEHIPPVRRRALIAGETLQQRGEVRVSFHRDDADGIPVELACPLRARALGVRGHALLRQVRHLAPLRWTDRSVGPGDHRHMRRSPHLSALVGREPSRFRLCPGHPAGPLRKGEPGACR
jgi:HD-GYP domain-containing protein (c-di-GMP phosphodiesterase class II)